MKSISSFGQYTAVCINQTFSATSRRRLSKGLAAGLICLAVLTLMSDGALYGQEEGSGDALFIDRNGNVGIGTNQPGEKLEVTGRIRDRTGFVMPVGTILPYAGSDAPAGWLPCNGSPYRVEDYADLFHVIGNTYGSDGDGTFRVPDLRGRGPMGLSGSDDFGRLGQTGGAETHRLTIEEMPSHTHPVNDQGHFHGFNRAQGDQNWNNGAGNTWWGRTASVRQDTTVDRTNIVIEETGGGSEHPVLDPYLTVNFIIKY